MLVYVPAGRPAPPTVLRLLDGPPSAPGAGPERWLQDRLLENPALALAGEVSPRHAGARSICCELPLEGAGYADWLGLTPTGEVVLAEVKLGRNAEARRDIVAQALDYHSVLRAMSFDALEAAALRASSTRLGPGQGLYEASGAPLAPTGLPPEEFRARVEDNLRRGAILLVLLLDRAPPGLVRLVASAFGDQPALPFHVSLVEVALHEAPGGGILLAPRLRSGILAVERAVVRVEGAAAITRPREAPQAFAGGRPGLDLDGFLATLEDGRRGLGSGLRDFLESAGRAVGLVPEVARSMVLRVDGVNVGSVSPKGGVGLWETGAAREAGAEAFEALGRRLHAIAGTVPRADRRPGEALFLGDLEPLLARREDWLGALREWRDGAQPQPGAEGDAP